MRSEFRLRRRHAVYATEALIAGTLTVHLTSCSILLPISAVQTNHRFPEGDLSLSRIEELPGRPRIRILTAAGDTIAGRFGGIRPMPMAEYAARYEEWRRAQSFEVPALDQRVRLRTKQRKTETGVFAGFGVRSIWFRHDQWLDDEYPIESLTWLRTSSGSEFRLDSLNAMARRNELPSRALVRVGGVAWVPEGVGWQRQNSTVLIPIDQVAGVILDSDVANPGVAFLAGAGIDALMVLGVASTYKSSSGCEGMDLSGINLWGGPYY